MESFQSLSEQLASVNRQIKSTTDSDTLHQLKRQQKILSDQVNKSAASYKSSLKANSSSSSIKEQRSAMNTPLSSTSSKNVEEAKVNSQLGSFKSEQKSSQSSQKQSSMKVEEAKVNPQLASFIKSEQKASQNNQTQSSQSSQSSGSASIDLCFLIDGTSSMQPWIDQTKDKVREIIKDARSSYSQFQFRIAVVVYRDFDRGSKSFEIQQFVRDASQVEMFLSQVKACGGGDAPEDINGGLQKVLSLNWKSPIKVLIHFADAPCHGPEFHNENDAYKCPPSDMDWGKIFDNLRSLAVEYNFLKINDSTDKMITKFKAYWQASGQKSGKPVKKAEFNEYSVSIAGLDLVKKIKLSLMGSIHRSIKNMSNTQDIMRAAIAGTCVQNNNDVFSQLSAMSKK